MSEGNDRQSFIECEDKEVFKQKISSQKEVIKEYKNWSQMLCNILNGSHNFEYYNQITNGIGKIENLCNENLTLKRAIFMKQIEQENNLKQINKIEEDIESIINNSKNSRSLYEKYNLMNSIETISEEVDLYSELNDTYIECSNIINKKDTIKKLEAELKLLKKENEQIKSRLLKPSSTNHHIILADSSNANSTASFLSCFAGQNDKLETLVLRK